MTLTDEVLFHCVSIPITFDYSTETNKECFTFQISAAVSVDGLSVEPSEAEICIVDWNCKCYKRAVTVHRSNSITCLCYHLCSNTNHYWLSPEVVPCE